VKPTHEFTVGDDMSAHGVHEVTSATHGGFESRQIQSVDAKIIGVLTEGGHGGV
jgi:hypothetical protein